MYTRFLERTFKVSVWASLILGVTQCAQAENSVAPLDLEEVVVTATAVNASKMEQSLSVSSIYQGQTNFSATFNAAELLSAIPGVRSESSGGEGNANITVRGLPISAGGARYVQLQEDGLPILQFGDVAFATADQFIRTSEVISRIEAVRGGSASTMATNAPGGVINFISQTGESQAGSLAITQGLGHTLNRYDFSYGQPLSNTNNRFFVSGFYREGDSVRDNNLKLKQGGQLNANITHEFDRGFVRLTGKYLQDHVPMLLPVPVTTRDGKISELPNVDPRKASFYSFYWQKNTTFDHTNRTIQSRINDGLSIDSRALGAEWQWDVTDTLTLEYKTRVSENSGRFIGIYPADNGYSNGPFRYATGAKVGLNYSDPVFTATVFDVALDDLGNTLSDLTLTKRLALSDLGDITATLGWYYSDQTLALTWQFNQYLMGLTGDNPALISNNQTATEPAGLLARGTDVFGGCCNRYIDVDYRTSAPYVSLGWASDHWTIDASVRQDQQQARGGINQAVNQQYLAANQTAVDYTVKETSYSVGINYQWQPDLALFARTSKGVSFNADRILFNGFALDGSSPIPVNQVQQHEVGLKWRYEGITAFLTLFDAVTEEINYEATTQRFTQRRYEANGSELELAYQAGRFAMQVGVTYTESRIDQAEDISVENNTPRRQPTWMYQVQPSWQAGLFDMGLSWVGATAAWGDDSNTIRLNRYTVLNGFIRTQFMQHFELVIRANNITNQRVFTEVEDDGHAARAMNGRSTTATIRYQF